MEEWGGSGDQEAERRRDGKPHGFMVSLYKFGFKVTNRPMASNATLKGLEPEILPYDKAATFALSLSPDTPGASPTHGQQCLGVLRFLAEGSGI
jgi:hypothetical protein